LINEAEISFSILLHQTPMNQKAMQSVKQLLGQGDQAISDFSWWPEKIHLVQLHRHGQNISP
jgi:hypothetical protein